MSFQAALGGIDSGEPQLPMTLRFLGSVLSPWRSAKDLRHDVDFAQCDWMHIYEYALQFMVLPLVHKRLIEKQATDLVPEDFLTAIEAFHDANNQRNQHHQQILLDATEILNRAQITPLLLKGAHSLIGLPPEADTRMVSDIDLLVLDDRIEEAQALLIAQGYQEHTYETAAKTAQMKTVHHHLPPLNHPRLPGFLEMHRVPNGWRQHPKLVDELTSKHRQRHSLSERHSVYIMDLEARLIYNQVHHYEADLFYGGCDFRQLVEQASIWALLGEEVVARILQKTEQQHPDFYAAMALQFALIQDLFAAPTLQATAVANSDSQFHLSALLKNPKQQQQQKKRIFLTMLRYLIALAKDPKRALENLTRLRWYKSLPGKIKAQLRSGRTLHRNGL
ncbi:MAG: nucleotidyltransferase family protein [Oceanobacter sp.]